MAPRGKRLCLRLGLGLAGLLFLFQGTDGFIARPAARLGGRRLSSPFTHAVAQPQPPQPTSSLPSVRGPRSGAAGPLWIKGQPSIDEDKDNNALAAAAASATASSQSAQEYVRSFAAAQGVDPRQLNLLLNLAFITFVAAFVLAKVVTVDVEFWRGWTPMEIFFRIPLDNWDGYMAVLTDHPIVVKGVTSCSVYAIGDWVAQMYEGKTLGEIDRGRVARSAAAGLIGHGPLSHMWYGVSEWFFDGVLRWEGWWTTFPKIAVDQLVWSPIWNACYIALLGIMKRESVGEIWEAIRSTSLNLIASGLKLWPLAHVVTYGVIPVENRLLWVDLVEILWVTILSREAAGHADGTAAAAAGKEGEEEGGKMGADAPVTVLAATAAGETIAAAAPAAVVGQEVSVAVPVPVPAVPAAAPEEEGGRLPQ